MAVAVRELNLLTSRASTLSDSHMKDQNLDTSRMENSNGSKSLPQPLITQPEEDDKTEVMISEGLSQIGRSADGAMQVFLSLKLRGKALQTADLLKDYVHIQNLDLSFNSIYDVKALSYMPFLISLDLSHNQLDSVLDFTPPLALRNVNLSHNNISYIPDLSYYHCLVRLSLDFNDISEISGLSACHRLAYLSITNNQIERISGLDQLPLKYLNLSHNKIKKIEGIQKHQGLQFLDLSNNQIRSLRGLADYRVLHTLLLENNEIIDLAETRYIRDLHFLRLLDLRNNPLESMPDYRVSLLFRLPHLTELDGIVVKAEEKVRAHNYFNPPMEQIVAADHRQNLMLSYQNTVQLLDSTLSSLDTPYPVLVITGPASCGKQLLVKKLCEDFHNYFKRCLSATTRPPRSSGNDSAYEERDGEHYYFVSPEQFDQDMKEGKMLQTCSIYGYSYGIARESMEAIAREGLACVINVELEGVMALKMSHFEPRFILILPESKKVHENRLRERDCFSESHIQQVIARTDLYQNYHIEHPGYFDAAICTDDMEEAYDQLKRIVLDYLGVSPWHSARSNITISSKSPATVVPITSSYEVGIGQEAKASPVSSGSRVKTISKSSSKKTETLREAKSTVTSPFEAASLERRFQQMKKATLGVTSSAEEQLAKVRAPLSPNLSLYGPPQPSSTEGTKRSLSAPQTLVSGYMSVLPDLSLDEAYVSQIKLSGDESSRTDSGDSMGTHNTAQFRDSVAWTPGRSEGALQDASEL